ncbi:hypothetical protein [Nocardioides aurantiacus]|uniref:hypothetical protein n=1 Tax=Nocardioides aurantiacus TaxID=86796 RepID=UPI000F48727D|nr:hypothetical protein [Nocardioides aurantiacus]
MTFSYYVVDTNGLSADDRAEVCQLVLRALEKTVVEFESDIPWSNQNAWPVRGREAAKALMTATGKPVDTESYQATGMIRRAHDDVWHAFTTFAGYALDASVWSENRVLPIVSLSDEGTAVVVRLDEEERRRLEVEVHPVPVLPLREAPAARRDRH